MWTSSTLWMHHNRGYSHLAGLVGVAMAYRVAGSEDNSKESRQVVQCHSGGAGTVSPPPSSSRGCRRKHLEAFLRKSDKQIDWDSLPVYTSAQIAQHNGTDSADVWMSYGGFVYNVTSFLPFHPGGTERISRAAGAAMEPYWYLHTQHFATDEPRQILSRLVVGRLQDGDQERIDAEIDALQENLDSFRLECKGAHGNTIRLSLTDLQNLPKTDLVSPIGCPSKAGGGGDPQPTSLFGGVTLCHLMKRIYAKYHVADNNNDNKAFTVVFHALDGESVRIENVHWRDNDILIAYEENGGPLSQQRGFPLRVIIPHKKCVVKWVCRIEIIR